MKNKSTLTDISLERTDDYLYSATPGANPVNVTAADMDGDGMIDLFFSRGGYSILKNSSSSNDISFSQQVDCYAGLGTNSFRRYVVADLDGDSKPDVASFNSEVDKMYFFRNTIGELFSACSGENTILKAGLTGLNYKWQVNSGTGFNDIKDHAYYLNENSEILDLWHPPSSLYGDQFRCIVDGNIGETFTLIFTNYWTGNENNDWNNPSNWTCGKVPDSNTDIIINSGNLVINSNITIRSLKVNPGATVTVSAGYTLTVLH